MTANEDENEMSSESDIKFNPPLYIQRYEKVFQIFSEAIDCTKIADFGCAEGKLLRRLKPLKEVSLIACIDCDDFSLEHCQYEARPLAWDFIFGRHNELRIDVFKGSVAEKDSRLKGFDAITCIELIEHLKSDLLPKLVENIFGFIGPKIVVITTPNTEYNVLFPQLKQTSRLRHWDHKFEWTRKEFDNWCHTICEKYPEYSYSTTGVGEPPIHSKSVGFCTQIAIFRKNSNNICNELIDNSDELLNYRLIGSYEYQRSTKTESNPKDEPFIDW